MTFPADLLSAIRTCLARRAYAEAEALCRTALKTHPDDTHGLHLLGASLAGLNRVEEAIVVLRRAAAQAPQDLEILNSCAIALYLSGEHEEAAEWFRSLLALQPAFAPAHFRLGLILHQKGEFERAATCYRRALAADASLRAAAECLEATQAGLFFGAGSGFQGSHAPQRQVFLSAAIHAMRETAEPLRILEIGSFMGSSALTMAHAIARLAGKRGTILCIDPWLPLQGYVNNEMNLMLGHGDGAYRAFLGNIATAPPGVSIDHRRGMSRDILPTLLPNSFDIVYIDGSHHYADVLGDIRGAERVLRDGGFLCGDDLELQEHESDGAYARQHLDTDAVTDPRTNRLFHPGVTLAVAETIGRVSVYDGFWIARRSGSAYAPVDLSDGEGLLPVHWPRHLVDDLRERFRVSRELRRVHG